jgi:hypothetical protein
MVFGDTLSYNCRTMHTNHYIIRGKSAIIAPLHWWSSWNPRLKAQVPYIATAQFHIGYSIDPNRPNTYVGDCLAWLPSLNVEYLPRSHSLHSLLLITAAKKPSLTSHKRYDHSWKTHSLSFLHTQLCLPYRVFPLFWSSHFSMTIQLGTLFWPIWPYYIHINSLFYYTFPFVDPFKMHFVCP